MERRQFVTSDGVSLSYIEMGEGQPLIMVPGWSQSAAQFSGQFEAFAKIARVIAVDPRGHGMSDNPAIGYRIQRIAKDLHELISGLGLEQPDMLGHSLGASMIWSYLSMFDAEVPPRRLVFVDQPAAILARKHWGEEEHANAGCLLPSLDELGQFENAVLACTTPETMKELLRPMFTDQVDEDTLLWVAKENLQFPRQHAMELLNDGAVHDWRSLIRSIRHPTLVIGGEASQVPSRSQRWIASQIAGAEVEIIEADQGGSHFSFIENPDRFNERVVRFLTAE